MLKENQNMAKIVPKVLLLTRNIRPLKHFKSTKHYRFKYIQAKTKQAENLLVSLHGYGQLIEYFSKKFTSLTEHYSLLFPEGMHRFYLNGTAGRVGASWMTKEDRQLDINDNMHWLSELIKEVKRKQRYRNIVLLGFSQGGATAFRLYHHLPEQFFSKLIIWANDFPKDIQNKTIYSPSIYVLGDQDEFIHGERATEIVAQYKENGFKICSYEGTHTIHEQSLQEILSA